MLCVCKADTYMCMYEYICVCVCGARLHGFEHPESKRTLIPWACGECADSSLNQCLPGFGRRMKQALNKAPLNPGPAGRAPRKTKLTVDYC